MIGLVVSALRLTIRLCFGMMDMVFWMCTLGKLDPKTRRFV
jgi:hypothetical protein